MRKQGTMSGPGRSGETGNGLGAKFQGRADVIKKIFMSKAYSRTLVGDRKVKTGH